MMPEELTVGLTAEVADGLRVSILPDMGKIICHWKVGWMDGETFMPLGDRVYEFTGDAFDLLAGGSHFKATKTNYQNIRDVIYGALRQVGQI